MVIKSEYYVVKNKRTKEEKRFRTFNGLREWWRCLGIDESLEWSGWDFVTEYRDRDGGDWCFTS